MKLTYRNAQEGDLTSLLRMLADDSLGKQREPVSGFLPEAYLRAFAAITDDGNNELIVVESDRAIVGMFQITYIPYLTYEGLWRALIEGVRVRKDCRGQGIGGNMFEWAIQRARERGCAMIQLTSDKRRSDALRFYERLGFVASHEGFKLRL
jgi:GNAT superfamily N-acetyltransferase